MAENRTFDDLAVARALADLVTLSGDEGEPARRTAAMATALIAGCTGATVTVALHGDTLLLASASPPRTSPDADAGAEIDLAGREPSLRVQLSVERGPAATLNLFADDPDVFTEQDTRAIIDVVVRHASVAMANASTHAAALRLSEQLRDAMATRAPIEQAKGILMAAEGWDEDTAFQALVRLSQRQGTKLREVAQTIVGQAQSGRLRKT